MLGTAELAALREVQEAGLPSTCTIQTATTAQDSIGQPLKTWAAAATGVACRLAQRSARERMLGEKATNVGDWVLTVAYDQAIDVGQRVLVGSQTFEVVGVDVGKSWALATRAGLVEVG